MRKGYNRNGEEGLPGVGVRKRVWQCESNRTNYVNVWNYQRINVINKVSSCFACHYTTTPVWEILFLRWVKWGYTQGCRKVGMSDMFPVVWYAQQVLSPCEFCVSKPCFIYHLCWDLKGDCRWSREQNRWVRMSSDFRRQLLLKRNPSRKIEIMPWESPLCQWWAGSNKDRAIWEFN